MATFVLVHDCWEGAWSWRAVEPLLRAEGHQVLTPTLTGLGERAHLVATDVGLTTHIQDVVSTLRSELVRDAILVGHGYGGLVIRGVADQVPDAVAHLVYLDAIVPEDGESALSLCRPDTATRLEAEARGFDGWRVPPPGHTQVLVPDRRVPHPLRCLRDAIALGTPSAFRCQRTYVHCAEAGRDAPLPPADLCAARVHAAAGQHVTLHTGHWPQVTMPRETANVLLQTADQLAAEAILQPSVVGVWRLLTCEVRRRDDSLVLPFGAEPAGTLVYTPDGFVCAILGERDRIPFGSSALYAGTPEQRAEALSSFIAYSGRFDLHDHHEVDHVLLASHPDWTGSIMGREMSVDGEHLSIKATGSLEDGGSGSVWNLVWERAGRAAAAPEAGASGRLPPPQIAARDARDAASPTPQCSRVGGRSREASAAFLAREFRSAEPARP